MKRILSILIGLTVFSTVHAQRQDCAVLLNHFLIVVDSITYQAIKNSEILKTDFAFIKERHKNWNGLYVVGQDNYIEIFHPNSIADECIPKGFTWICQASLAANCIEEYDLPDNDHITYNAGGSYNELSVNVKDSLYARDTASLMTTVQMNKGQYESWTKKPYNDSLQFLTTDYNSAAESDASKNYLFNNITGIQINLNLRDSLSITQYLNVIGYTAVLSSEQSIKFSNTIDFIELDFSKNVDFATISVIYFELNQESVLKNISLGNSEIRIDGDRGYWTLQK